MATFTDHNGETRLEGSLDGTNAGTLVGSPTDPFAAAFQAKPSAGATSNPTNEYELYDDTGTLIGSWDAAGGFQTSLDDPNFGTFFVRNKATGLALVNIQVNSGIILTAPSGTGVFITTETGSHTLVQATDDNKLGFYGHAATALQTGVAVNAAGIHAALVNLGLITA